MASNTRDCDDTCLGDIEERVEHLSTDENKQTDAERRNLRLFYRKLKTEVKGNDDDDSEVESTLSTANEGHKILWHLEEIDQQFPNVKHTREAALDAQVYSLITNCAKQNIQNLQTNLLKFDPEEYAEQLKTYFDVDRIQYPTGLPDEKWIEIGKASSKFFKRAPTFHFVANTFDPGEVAPRVIQRRPRAPKDASNDKATIVEKVSHAQPSKESTTEEVEDLYKLMWTLFIRNDREPYCYLKLVIDPFSFPRTIENIFHVSFLVKDGLAKVYYDDCSLPVIEPVKKQPGGVTTSEDNDKLALAIGLSKPEWEQIIKVFKLTKAQIPRKNRAQ